VLAWINVLEYAQLEKQAAQQGYFPRWVVAGFNLVTDTVGMTSTVRRASPRRIWVTPEYHNGTLPSAWAGTSFMRDAYANTTPDTPSPNRLAGLARVQSTTRCSRLRKDCTRNKVAGMMLSGYPQQCRRCAISTSSGRGKLGSFDFTSGTP